MLVAAVVVEVEEDVLEAGKLVLKRKEARRDRD